MKVLFICNQNKHRSKTAEIIFRNRFETKSAGLYNKSSVTNHQIIWADVIFVMEDVQRQELSIRFPELYLQKQILTLNIPDIYQYNQPELVNLLKKKVNALL